MLSIFIDVHMTSNVHVKCETCHANVYNIIWKGKWYICKVRKQTLAGVCSYIYFERTGFIDRGAVV